MHSNSNAPKGKVSVRHLIEHAILNDAYTDSEEDKWDLLDEKFWGLNPAFVDDVQQSGIRWPINYNPRTNTLYNGHHRVLVAWLLNIEEIEYDMDCWDNFSMGPHNWGTYAVVHDNPPPSWATQ